MNYKIENDSLLINLVSWLIILLVFTIKYQNLKLNMSTNWDTLLSVYGLAFSTISSALSLINYCQYKDSALIASLLLNFALLGLLWVASDFFWFDLILMVI